MSDALAPHFADEIRAAGLGAVPFSWRPDTGAIEFSRGVSAAEIERVIAVAAEHRPDGRPARPEAPIPDIDDVVVASALVDEAKSVDDIRPLLKAIVNKVAVRGRGAQ